MAHSSVHRACVEILFRVNNLLDRQYSAASLLSPPGFDNNGNFIARPETPATAPLRPHLRDGKLVTMNAQGLDMVPFRLVPGNDLKEALEDAARGAALEGGFVVSGIGSLATASVRFAGERSSTVLQGPFEILTLQGSLSPDGSHLHIAIADAHGNVRGGHVASGCTVYTTAEILVARVPGFRFSRELDGATGHRELRVEPTRR
jgi:predicted DNA-binding protein with PD1-like motif